ncbi:Alpha-mannosidase G [Zancudomyces culisetae]|nr:Alpha-mannosidase G [Zancudomyces culisetae]|eukprot:OMH79596.1 Alpha-mannosidase G [Zancudomyces culisetae]
MIWTKKGEPVQGLTGGGSSRRIEYLLTKKAGKREKFDFFVEIGCNGLFGNGDGIIEAPVEDRRFRLSLAEVGVKRKQAWDLYYDMMILSSIADELGTETPRGVQAVSVANEVVNKFDADNAETSIEKCLELTKAYFSSKPGEGTHKITAIGNCHIDTAWLWPYDETKRKVARSFSSQLAHMEKFPEFRFAASQAQQFEWLEQNYKGLFDRVIGRVKTGQFIPIGATWVEMDCNVPSGEAMVRQFLLGQRYFAEKMGVVSKVFWLPDTFGYAAQLPQIVKQSRAEYFFTQKLSWNNINKFPHTTFNWVGLDGTSVLTHMAPADTYTGQATVNELVRSVRQHKDLSSHNSNLYLYGDGDGGGGPQTDMIERLRRVANTDGMPITKHGDPTDFYDEVAKTAKSLPNWHGELYFELHRGTYTSQAKNKKFNRLCEFLLRSVELLSTIAMHCGSQNSGFMYPREELTRLWKLVCLNQFHDVLPGSSINLVYRDSDKMYADVVRSANKLRKEALRCIVSGEADQFEDLEHESAQDDDLDALDLCDSAMLIDLPEFHVGKNMPKATNEQNVVVINECAWSRSGALAVHGLEQDHPMVRQIGNPRMSIFKQGWSDVASSKPYPIVLAANLPALSTTTLSTTPLDPIPASAYVSSNGLYVLENIYVVASFDSRGRLVSLIDQRTSRELVPSGGAANTFLMFEDVPLFWDAWDVEIYHLEKCKACVDGTVSIVDSGPLVSSLCIDVKLSNTSTLRQWVTLTSVSPTLEFHNEVHWNETFKMLKVEFNWDIKSDIASYETQFGYIQRPTVRNNSWDMAKFEVCGHKYADLSEFGAGVSVLTDSKYGFSCLHNAMTISLLRSPKSPDPECDIGYHTFRYAIYPHNSSFPDPSIVREAFSFNVPLKAIPVYSSSISPSSPLVTASKESGISSKSLFSLSNSVNNVVLETVKCAEPLLDMSYSSPQQVGVPRKPSPPSSCAKMVVVRLYESCGGRANSFKLFSSLDIKSVHRCNMLEEILSDCVWDRNTNSVELSIKPFEVLSLLFVLN